MWGGMSEDSWLINRLMIGVQIFDLAVTALVPELRKAEHLGHHISTLFCALGTASLGGPHFCYYVPFYFAFIEISSVPLVFVDLFRQLPELAEGRLGSTLNEIMRTSFVVTFLPIRCIWFPYAMITGLWPDMYAVYMAGDMRCSAGVFWGMLACCWILMFLQLFWGYKIMRVVLKGNVTGKGAKGAAASKETD